MKTIEGWRPLLRWDGTHLVTGLDSVNTMLQKAVADNDRVRSVVADGAGDRVTITATVRAAGVEPTIEVDLREIRLRHGFLGFRVARLAVLGGLRLPRVVVEEALERALPPGMTVYRKSGIVVLNLAAHLPRNLDLRVISVQVVGGALHVWVGPGFLSKWPEAPAPQLATGDKA